jgi:hypothetical protein
LVGVGRWWAAEVAVFESVAVAFEGIRRHEQRPQRRDPLEEHRPPPRPADPFMITDVSINGNCANNSRIAGSTSSTADPEPAR